MGMIGRREWNEYDNRSMITVQSVCNLAYGLGGRISFDLFNVFYICFIRKILSHLTLLSTNSPSCRRTVFNSITTFFIRLAGCSSISFPLLDFVTRENIEGFMDENNRCNNIYYNNFNACNHTSRGATHNANRQHPSFQVIPNDIW